MTIHLPSLPHTQVTSEFDWCAYTAKVRRLTHMLEAQGYETITYCGEEFEGAGWYETIVTPAKLKRWFGGPWDTNKVFDQWDHEAQCWVEMNKLALRKIRKNWEPGDVLGIIAGFCQASLAAQFDGPVLEWGIGYEGVLDNTVHAYESQAWRHYVSGKKGWGDGRNFDTVIPNAFDPEDYRTGKDQGYLLYLGRHTARKGTAVVEELAKSGHRVITAGQDGPLEGCEYRGVVVGADKKALLAGATAVLVPTTYIEPFGGVAVEAMMSGVPAITTDYGAFTETVIQGHTGLRCSTLEQFEIAARIAPQLRGKEIRDITKKRFSTGVVAEQYRQWIQRAITLRGNGWYQRTMVLPELTQHT
jgi:hypothetical protein